MTRHLFTSSVVPLCALTFAACSGSPTSPGSDTSSYLLPVNRVTDATYSMTLSIDSCAVLPEGERTRTYAASIASTATGQRVVTLSGARFLDGPICSSYTGGLGCNQFLLATANDGVTVALENHNDEAHGGHIVEQSSSGTWMEIIGDLAGTDDSQTIDASGSGTVWYCANPRGYPFPCPTFSSCPRAGFRMQLTRR